MGCGTSGVAPASSPGSRRHHADKAGLGWATHHQNNGTSSHHQAGGLSHLQKTTIWDQWGILEGDSIALGSKVFLLIFEEHPDIKVVFSCKEMTPKELSESANFKQHASRFIGTVGKVVDNIEDFDQVTTPLLNELGRKHIHFRGFKPTYFNVFQSAMARVWQESLGEEFTEEAREAWILIFEFIVRELKRGYSQAIIDGSAGSEVKSEDID